MSMEEVQAQQIQQIQQFDGTQNQLADQSDPQSLQGSNTESDDQLQNMLVSSDNLQTLVSPQDTLGESPLDGLSNTQILEMLNGLDTGTLGDGLPLQNVGLLGSAGSLLGSGLLGSIGGGSLAQEGSNQAGKALSGSLLNADVLDTKTIMKQQAPAAKVFKVIQQTAQ